jgi:TRAP-type C4-dicarboxylate transport system permease small subunit
MPTSWVLPLRLLGKLSGFLAVLEGIGIGLCLLGVTGLASWQCIARNIPSVIPRVPLWSDGVIRHSVFMLGFLGGAYATYTGRHIRIDAITRMLAPRMKMALRVVTTLAAFTVVTLFVIAAREFYQVTLEEAGEASQADQLFTSSRGALIIISGYCVIAFHFFVQILIDVGYLVTGATPPPEWLQEASH